MHYDISFGRAMWPNLEVAGEFAREANIVKVIGGRPAPNKDIEIEDVPIALVLEPDNAHDRNAVMVQVNGLTLGYLTREDAKLYQQPLTRLAASGCVATTVGRIWASTDNWDGRKKFRSRVTVALPPVEMMLPLNNPPKGNYNLLPWGGGLQVTKEEDHFDVLFHHVPPAGTGLAYVTLHKGIRTLKNGTEKPFVETRIDGERVGEMTPATSGHFLPLIEHLDTAGEIPTALAKITGSALAAQLVLQAAKAPEIPDSWMASSPNQVPRLAEWQEEYEPTALSGATSERGKVTPRASDVTAARKPVAPAKLATPAGQPFIPRPAEAPPTAVSATAAHPTKKQSPAAEPAQRGNAVRAALLVALVVAMFGTLIFFAAGINLFVRADVSAGIACMVIAAGGGWLSWKLRRQLKGRTAKSAAKATSGRGHQTGRERVEESQERDQ